MMTHDTMTDHNSAQAGAAATAAAAHGGHGGHGGHGDHVTMFRRRFWWSLLLTFPMVVTSHMVMDWFGYDLDFPGMSWVGPVLGSVVFFWAGWPFLRRHWKL